MARLLSFDTRRLPDAVTLNVERYRGNPVFRSVSGEVSRKKVCLFAKRLRANIHSGFNLRMGCCGLVACFLWNRDFIGER